jgi:DUF4097 and DUF4098 domain-containing protein YvlB
MSRSERFDVGQRPSLDVRVPVGTIEIYAGDAGVVQLTIDANDVDEFEVFASGDRVTVRHPSRWGRRGRDSRLVAHVPAGTDLEIQTTSGEVRLVGRHGVVGVHTATGDIQLGDAGRIDITTASGDLGGGEVDGDATISSVSGDCTLRHVGGRLEVALTSGDLRIDGCDGDVSVSSTSGDVRVGRCGGSDIAVRSISGDIRVGLPSGIRVEASISTLSGRATLPDPAPAADAGDRRPVRLQLKTVSGDIRIERTA